MEQGIADGSGGAMARWRRAGGAPLRGGTGAAASRPMIEAELALLESQILA